MKKLYAFWIMILLFVAVPLSVAQAGRSRLYFAGYLGLNKHPQLKYTEKTSSAGGELEMQNGLNFAGALGIRYNKNLRLEAEWGYHKAKTSMIETNGRSETPVSGEIKTNTIMLTGIYDFDVNWEDIFPFVSAGAGIAWHNGEVYEAGNMTADVSGYDMGLAWTLGGGIRYDVQDGMSVTAGYRYLGTTEIGIENATIDYGAHEFRLGINYDIKSKLK